MTALSYLRYHYFYKITKIDTDQYYYGIHSTNNLNDGYMGSGNILRRFIKKYGKDKFTKEIIKFFDNRKDLSSYEQQMVNEELLKDPLCLNLALGGDIKGQQLGVTKGLVTVRDKDGNCFDVRKDDPRYLSKELLPACIGLATVRDNEGRCFKISVNDPDYIAGKYIPVSKGNKGIKGKTTIYKDGTYLLVEVKDLDKYKELGWEIRSKCRGRISPTKGMVHLMKGDEHIMVKKSKMQEYIDDGWVNKRNVQPFKGTVCLTKDGKNLYIDPKNIQSYLDAGWSKGGTSRNKGKVTCSLDDGKTYVQLDKNDPLILSGKAKTVVQLKGSPCKGLKYVHKGNIIRRVKESELETYIKEGYKLGMRKDK